MAFDPNAPSEEVHLGFDPGVASEPATPAIEDSPFLRNMLNPDAYSWAKGNILGPLQYAGRAAQREAIPYAQRHPGAMGDLGIPGYRPPPLPTVPPPEPEQSGLAGFLAKGAEAVSTPDELAKTIAAPAATALGIGLGEGGRQLGYPKTGQALAFGAGLLAGGRGGPWATGIPTAEEGLFSSLVGGPKTKAEAGQVLQDMAGDWISSGKPASPANKSFIGELDSAKNPEDAIDRAMTSNAREATFLRSEMPEAANAMGAFHLGQMQKNPKLWNLLSDEQKRSFMPDEFGRSILDRRAAPSGGRILPHVVRLGVGGGLGFAGSHLAGRYGLGLGIALPHMVAPFIEPAIGAITTEAMPAIGRAVGRAGPNLLGGGAAIR